MRYCSVRVNFSGECWRSAYLLRTSTSMLRRVPGIRVWRLVEIRGYLGFGSWLGQVSHPGDEWEWGTKQYKPLSTMFWPQGGLWSMALVRSQGRPGELANLKFNLDRCFLYNVGFLGETSPVIFFSQRLLDPALCLYYSLWPIKSWLELYTSQSNINFF